MRVCPWLLACLAATLGITTVAMRTTVSEVYMSTLNVERMLAEEENLLEELRKFIDTQHERLKTFSSFYSDRLLEVIFRNKTDIDLNHPNSIYNIMKSYTKLYSHALGEHFRTFYARIENSTSVFLSGFQDLEGGRTSLLRLQEVYGLRASDMARGDYLGYQGPQLEPLDAFKIAYTAFTESQFNESLEWLNVSLTMHHEGRPFPTIGERGHPTNATIKAFLGRIHLYNRNKEAARELYKEARQLDHTSAEVKELGKELEKKLASDNNTHSNDPDDRFLNYKRLCRLQNGIHAVARNDRTRPLFCRYREAVLQYYTFKEEILSFSPFVSVIYDVIADYESDFIKQLVIHRLTSAELGPRYEKNFQTRSGGVAWARESESNILAGVSERISAITGLETIHRRLDLPMPAEPMQIVNYGMAGHYDVHWDVMNDTLGEEAAIKYGDRIATFLIYLNDVERGGATVFPYLGVSVAPIKNMALFWYNINPANEIEMSTLHGGCSVLIGQKWIVNKWMWSNGNWHRRRCGQRADATQLDIEPDMKRRYK